MRLDFVDPLRWYAIDQVAKILGWGRDTIIRLIEKGHLEAVTLPEMNRERNRVYSSRRVQGNAIIEFVKKNSGRKS